VGATTTAWQEGTNYVSGGAVGINLNEAPHVDKDSTLLLVHVILQKKSICWWKGLIGITTSTWTALKTDILHMGHDIRDRLRDYC
jgi:hypothetical protein